MANLDRNGLTQDELETLMHEFGHVLHGVLSRVEYNPDAGTAVKNDFVEAPSQMFEEWARREQPLDLFKQVCPDCPHLTHDEIERLEAAHHYGQGTRYARQWLYASYDMALSHGSAAAAGGLEEVRVATPLGYVEGTMFPASFSHIASNYGAGYYGYMWSEVLALDMLTPFKKNMLDPAVGRRYRDTILANGGPGRGDGAGEAFPRARALERRVLRGDHGEALTLRELEAESRVQHGGGGEADSPPRSDSTDVLCSARWRRACRRRARCRCRGLWRPPPEASRLVPLTASCATFTGCAGFIGTMIGPAARKPPALVEPQVAVGGLDLRHRGAVAPRDRIQRFAAPAGTWSS